MAPNSSPTSISDDLTRTRHWLDRVDALLDALLDVDLMTGTDYRDTSSGGAESTAYSDLRQAPLIAFAAWYATS